MGAEVRDLLLAPRLVPDRVEALLRPYGFRDPQRADRDLQALAGDPHARTLLASMLEEVLRAAAASADPESALSRFEHLARAEGSPSRLLSHLRSDPRLVEVVLRVLGGSPYVAETLVRHPEWVYWLSEPGVLQRPRSRREIEADLRRSLGPLRALERQKDALRVAKRREILHIAVRDLLHLASVDETLAALSLLAGALIEAALHVAAGDARRAPLRGFTVLGMGKLGGGELNFSSDVDLIYVYDRDSGRWGRGDAAPARGQYFQDLARRLTAVLAEVTQEGHVYRVDLRLRPEGRMGSVALPLPAFARYYRTRGATWERLALLKAWPVAGDRALGATVLERLRPFVYGRPFAEAALGEVRRLKRQIDQRMAVRAESARHVKLGVGGIREVELLTQVLQLRHGRRRAGLRQRGTMAALTALSGAGLLGAGEHQTVARAYLFLRDVENKLQVVSNTQVHALPLDAEGLRACARRLGYQDRPGLAASDAFLADYRRHTAAVHEIFRRVLGHD
jgi:[glutamine synthetase] adenylyltransferase / [glutamine synthetase]-adenylyl-L-tyrosine phosphorylase